MTPEEAVRARILALSAVTALVSTRVWTEKLPQKPIFPCVVVQEVTDSEGQHLRGPSGLCVARVQVEAQAMEVSGTDPYAAAATLAAAIHGDGLGTAASGLFGWIGAIGSPPFQIRGVKAGPRTRRYDAGELRVMTILRDYLVTYRRPA